MGPLHERPTGPRAWTASERRDCLGERGRWSGARGSATARTALTACLDVQVNALFNFEPFFALATKNARDMMVQRGSTIGVDWAQRISDLEGHDWEVRVLAPESEATGPPLRGLLAATGRARDPMGCYDSVRSPLAAVPMA